MRMFVLFLVAISSSAFASDGEFKCVGTTLSIRGVFVAGRHEPVQVQLTDVVVEDDQEIIQTADLAVKTFTQDKESLSTSFSLKGDSQPFEIKNALYNSEAKGYWGTLTKNSYQGHPGRNLETAVLCESME